MMAEKVSKFFLNPIHYSILGFRSILSLILFPFYKIIFGSIRGVCFISFKSSILNFKNIKLGKGVQINPFVTIWPTKLIIGDNVQINPGTAIYGKVSIGNNVMIAPNCMIVGGNHGIENKGIPMIFQESLEKGILIEDDVWIGANSTIVDGVRIAKGSVIGAGSVVTRDTQPFSVNVGVPSKIIKLRE